LTQTVLELDSLSDTGPLLVATEAPQPWLEPKNCGLGPEETQIVDTQFPETMQMEGGVVARARIDGLWPGGGPPKNLTAAEKISQSLETFGLHDAQFLSFVQEMSIKVGEIAGSALENNRLKLNAAMSELHASLEVISISNETEFRAQMKKYGDCLARHQVAIDLILDQLKLSIASEAKSVVAEGKVARDICIEYTSFYVATTIHSQFHGDKAQLEILKRVLITLKQATATTKNPIFPDAVAEMYSLIAGVQPTTTTPSTTGATSSDAPPSGKKKRKR